MKCHRLLSTLPHAKLKRLLKPDNDCHINAQKAHSTFGGRGKLPIAVKSTVKLTVILTSKKKKPMLHKHIAASKGIMQNCLRRAWVLLTLPGT